MRCTSCGADNKEGLKFCTSCGSSLGADCPGCGAPLEPGDVFCGQCGRSVTASEPATGGVARPRPVEARSAPVAERRVVSVLFVDLVGFTSYSEGRDAEDVRGLLSEYFEKAGEIVGLHGGVIEKFIGDAVMAVWGTPVAREDDSVRAVRSALELVEAVARLGRSVGADLRARAGIFTGEAAVNLAAQGQGMVAGDMVNTASRLQSAAGSGTILVDRATYLGARDEVSFESMGALTLKGKQEPVEAWRPKRVIAGADGFKQGEALEPAFTGRDEEFRLIKDLIHATGREGRPRLASVVGVGGVGKSRLVWELFKYLDGLSDRIFWHQGRSPSYGDGVAFWALAEMVRMRARIAETDDDDQARAKLDDCLERWIPDEDERRWLRPHLAHLLGFERTDIAHEQLFAAWRIFFERVAAEGTVLLVFEDLHWADPGLIDFIEHLMAWSRSSPLAIMTFARPELLDNRPSWGAGQRNFISIHLEPLEHDDMNLLLKSVVSDLPSGIHEEIIERSEGIPLYAVEMLRMFIDRGDLVAQDDGYRWTGQVDHVDVPDSLHALIASRLDSLPNEDRLLVQDAAVLGKTFTVESLGAVAARSPGDLTDRLDDLVRREILLVDTDPRSPERGQYGFVQSLIREIAYQTLSNSSKKERHLAAAQYFDSLDEVDLIDVVANHYLEAYSNARNDSDAPMLAERARAALVDAAGRSQSLASNAQALSLLEKAIAISDDSSDQGQLLSEAGNAALKCGRIEEAVGYLNSAITALRASGETALLARAQSKLGLAYFHLSKLDEAEQMLAGALEELDDTSTPEAATILVEAGRIQVFKGNYEEGGRLTDLALPPAERAERLDLVSEALITRAVAALLSGRLHEADALLVGALKLSREHDLPSQQIRALLNIAANQLQIDPRAAFTSAGEAVAVARRLGLMEQEAFALGNALEGAVLCAEWEWLRAELADIEERDMGYTAVILLPSIAVAEAFTGNLERARTAAENYARQIGETSSVQDQAAVITARAMVTFMEGDYEKVVLDVESGPTQTFEFVAPYGLVGRAALWSGDVAAAERELERARLSPSRSATITCFRQNLEAGIAALREDRAAAIPMFEKAIADWASLDAPLNKALSQMDFALLVGGPETESAASEAEEFFRVAGNDILVARLREAHATV